MTCVVNINDPGTLVAFGVDYRSKSATWKNGFICPDHEFGRGSGQMERMNPYLSPHRATRAGFRCRNAA